MIEPKIQKVICDEIKPLFDIWKENANWTNEESIVMYHKLFDPEKPNDLTILKILAEKLGNEYKYFHERKINRIYKTARRKLNKILP